MFFFFKQKTAYEMRISDWSSDVCSSDLIPRANWRSFVPPQIAAILGTTRHCVLLIARGSTAIFSVFCGTDERFCFDPPRDREERCALNRLRHPDQSAGSTGFSGSASGSTAALVALPARGRP